MNIDQRRRSAGANTGRLIAAGVLLLGAGVAAWLLWLRNPDPAPPQVGTLPAAPATPALPTGPKYPLEQSATLTLPKLNDSDKFVGSQLAPLAGSGGIESMLQLDQVVRRIVVTIDNMPRQQLAARLNPLVPVKGRLITTGKDDTLTLAPANAARYTPYVRLAEAIDTQKLVAIYRSLYPLFQEAYAELGYGNAYFNDRVIEVIDHLLQTPEVTGPIKLVVNHVLPEFADEELQSRSAGQKMLIRAGAENTRRIKAKLREIRGAIVGMPTAG